MRQKRKFMFFQILLTVEMLGIQTQRKKGNIHELHNIEGHKQKKWTIGSTMEKVQMQI